MAMCYCMKWRAPPSWRTCRGQNVTFFLSPHPPPRQLRISYSSSWCWRLFFSISYEFSSLGQDLDEPSYWLIWIGGHRLGSKIKYEGFEADLYMKHWCPRTLCTILYRPQSTQSDGPVRFLIFFSISISLLASLVAGRRPWATIAGNVLQYTYPLEYQTCTSRPRQKSCWAISLRI